MPAVSHDDFGKADVQHALLLDLVHVAAPRFVDGDPAAEGRARETAPSFSGLPSLYEAHEELAVVHSTQIVPVLQPDLDGRAAACCYSYADAGFEGPYL